MAKSKKKAKAGIKKPLKECAKWEAILARSGRSAAGRRKNILANMANARIKGHARGSQRRAQATRDSKHRAG